MTVRELYEELGRQVLANPNAEVRVVLYGYESPGRNVAVKYVNGGGIHNFNIVGEVKR